MKKRILLSILFILGLISTTGASIREKYNFNPDWKVFIGEDPKAKDLAYDDSKWLAVHLPVNQKNSDVIWFRKIFSVPSEFNGKKVFIEFEGAGKATEIWVNGKKVGVHEEDIMAFGFDLTSYIHFGKGKDNVIAVRMEKSSGLTKNVFLHITDKLHQTLPLYNSLKTKGVYVYADNFDVKGKRAIIHIESEIRNDYEKPRTFKLNVLVRDNEKLLVREFQSEEVTLQPGETKTVSTSATMRNIQFWSWGFGYLYEVNTTVVVGNKVVDLVRIKTGFRKTDFINGQVRLNDRVLQLKGYAQNSANQWSEAGSAVPAWLSDYSNKQMVEGNANLVRWTNLMPWKQDIESCDRAGLIQILPTSDVDEQQDEKNWEQCKDVMRDAIIYNRNNPSILFYECGNKELSEEKMGEMLAIRNEFDPKGGRIIGAPDMLGSKKAEYSGEMSFVTKSADQPVLAMAYPTYAENQDEHAKESVARWYDFWLERPGTGRRVNAGAVTNDSPDDLRIKKDNWFVNQVQWDGWVDFENYRTHIVGHWNYEKGLKKDVHVVSSGDRVELFLNGKSLGFGEKSSGFWFTFKNVAYQPGELRAVSYDKSKVVLSEAVCRTAGLPKNIRLNLMVGPDSLQADGADMALIEVEVLDAKGQRCPLAADQINLEVKGPVEFLNGKTQSDNKQMGAQNLALEAGVGRILLRSTRQAGSVTVIASSGDLILDSLNFRSKHVDVTRGLSTYLPGQNQPASLVRGETPITTSYSVSRIPVSVFGVLAGSNEEQAFFSMDDSESSEWKSNGPVSKAWITFSLNRQASLSEICLKLGDYNSRSYDFRILNEDNVVLWEGKTSISNGYVTLPLARDIVSRTIRVEAVSPGEELRIVEIEFYESVAF